MLTEADSPPAGQPRVPPRHLAVVGLMGAGKTTVGQLVAKTLGVAFRDNDAALTRRTGLTAAALAAEQGLDALHAAEAAALLDLLGEPRPAVVAAAASTIDEPACRAALAEQAFVVWLHGDVGLLAARATTGRHRPLAGDVLAQFRVQAEARAPAFAAAADLTLDVATGDPATLAATVVDAARRAGVAVATVT